MEVESVTKAKATRAKKKALSSKFVGAIDNTVDEVLEWAEEGREIYFADHKEFLEIPKQVYDVLTPMSRERYRLAKRLTMGEDVVSSMLDAERGWAKDYNVRPGSFGDNSEVFGKDPDYDYYLSTPTKLSGRYATEWEIDHDPNVHMLTKESGTLKTVGGENKPELILLRRKKSIGIKYAKKKLERHNNLIDKTKESFVENASKVGVVAKIDS